MKVAMVDPSLFTGRYDEALCGALGRRGHDVILAGRPLRSTDVLTPCNYRYLPCFFRVGEGVPGRVQRVVKAAEYLASALTRPNPALAASDIVHWQWLPFALVDRFRLRRPKGGPCLIHTVHNARPYHGGGRLQAMGYRALIDRFDALIVHGEETRDALTAQGVVPPISIVPHPPMRLAPSDAAALAAMPASKRPRVVFFGTIKPYKGLDLLVDAALSLWRAGADFDLVVAGQPFMPVADLFGRIHVGGYGDRLIVDLGFLTEQRLDAHLTRADILVFPYRDIDSSGAFLSACHYGAAMVTSDCGMFARLPGSAVSRFAAGDAAGLADVLRPLLADQAVRERAGAAAIALGETLGSWDEAAARTEAVYVDAHARKSRA